MSNLFNNRLSVTISDADMQTLRSYILDMESILGFMIGLTQEEQASLPKISRDNKLFVEDALLALQDNAHLAPAYVDPVELAKDLKLFEQLVELEQLLARITGKMHHTRLLAGSEAYQTSLSFYRMVKSAAANGYPGAAAVAERLGIRFKIRRNGGDGAALPPEASDTPPPSFPEAPAGSPPLPPLSN